MALRHLLPALAVIAAIAPAHAIDLKQAPLSDSIGIDLDVLPNDRAVGRLPVALQTVGCTVYEDVDGGGESWFIPVRTFVSNSGDEERYSETIATVGEWWNDRISSVQCGHGGISNFNYGSGYMCMIDVYDDINLAGALRSVVADEGLQNIQNDVVSSFEVFCNIKL